MKTKHMGDPMKIINEYRGQLSPSDNAWAYNSGSKRTTDHCAVL